MTSRLLLSLTISLLQIAASAAPAAASHGSGSGGPITFTDIAAGGGAGIGYTRTPSPAEAIFDAIKQQPTYTFPDLLATPLKARGAPGVAILDYDRDGDLDIFVTNGPGTAHSLFANQLAQSGSLTFVDTAAQAGVDAVGQDGTGVCFGDIDNDGDHDLLVLGNLEPNRLFENLGNGSFVDISGPSGVGLAIATSTSCSMGDIDGDGLLDIAVANTLDMSHQVGIFIDPFGFNQPNQLLKNLGGNVFDDVSASSGILDLDLPVAPPGAATISWAIAMVDIDLDGDIDLMHGDDQAAVPISALGGVDRGYLQLHINDGSGHFTAVGLSRGLVSPAPWMGLSYGDFDGNGTLDVFGSNFGNHGGVAFTGMVPDFSVQNGDSRWFLQRHDGTFEDSAAGGPLHTPFGWGTSAFDYDNDGDTDIVFHGGLDVGPFVATNPGSLLANDGAADFSRDTVALAGSADHLRRTVHGSAVGDLDNDGFVDMVSVSNQDLGVALPLTPAPILGGEFQTDAFVLFTFLPIDPVNFVFQWAGFVLDNGTLAVERSSGNGNRFVQIEVKGSVGLTPRGRVNRDGIGAVVEVTPKNRTPVLLPVLGGSSYASQDSLRQTAGLGSKKRATVEVLWPGGVRNRRYHVKHGTRLTFPEVPCSIDTPAPFGLYAACVIHSLADLVGAGVIDAGEALRFFGSAIVAYFDER